jgi:hypothetical protein
MGYLRKKNSKSHCIALEEESACAIYKLGVPPSHVTRNMELLASFKLNHSKEAYQEVTRLERESRQDCKEKGQEGDFPSNTPLIYLMHIVG